MPQPRPPLSEVIPPLILGTATFNTQYVADPTLMPYASIVSLALERGIVAFDTSPYYGPSETLLGDALSKLSPPAPRSSFLLITKVGRIASREFDYSPGMVRASVQRSLERLKTDYLDLVYCHDVEFVSAGEVLAAVRELRRLRAEGVLRYVGISGYPLPILTSLARMILYETGEPLDAVLSYCNFTVQNASLGSEGSLSAFEDAKVDVVLNASVLGMGLLTTRGVDAGPMSKWHPSPPELRATCRKLVDIARGAGRRLEDISICWALGAWAITGARFGSKTPPREPDSLEHRPSVADRERFGVTVVGVSTVEELEETCSIWRAVRGDDLAAWDGTRVLVEDTMWNCLGEWRDFTWDSPPRGWTGTSASAELIRERE